MILSNLTHVEPKKDNSESTAIEVECLFVRGRNALVTRADFSEIYVDYYLHQGQHGYQHDPAHDGLFKEALAALTLHCASKPWKESVAWTVHFENPMLNLFVNGENPNGRVTGQIFTEKVREVGANRFLAETLRATGKLQRSVVEFEGTDPLAAAEHYYMQSEQRPARFFRSETDAFMMVSAQPDCDLAWLSALSPQIAWGLDETEELSLLEKRTYQWQCGCNHDQMCSVLSTVSDQDGLFGHSPQLTMGCPRCGARYVITREALEAFIKQK